MSHFQFCMFRGCALKATHKCMKCFEPLCEPHFNAKACDRMPVNMPDGATTIEHHEPRAQKCDHGILLSEVCLLCRKFTSRTEGQVAMLDWFSTLTMDQQRTIKYQFEKEWIYDNTRVEPYDIRAQLKEYGRNRNLVEASRATILLEVIHAYMARDQWLKQAFQNEQSFQRVACELKAVREQVAIWKEDAKKMMNSVKEYNEKAPL